MKSYIYCYSIDMEERAVTCSGVRAIVEVKRARVLSLKGGKLL